MNQIDLIHPGEHLAEILDELGISQYRLAKAIGAPPRRINEIVHGRRAITADTALRIGQALGMTPEFWLNLQKLYDLDLARSAPPSISKTSNRWLQQVDRERRHGRRGQLEQRDDRDRVRVGVSRIYKKPQASPRLVSSNLTNSSTSLVAMFSGGQTRITLP